MVNFNQYSDGVQMLCHNSFDSGGYLVSFKSVAFSGYIYTVNMPPVSPLSAVSESIPPPRIKV